MSKYDKNKYVTFEQDKESGLSIVFSPGYYETRESVWDTTVPKWPHTKNSLRDALCLVAAGVSYSKGWDILSVQYPDFSSFIRRTSYRDRMARWTYYYSTRIEELKSFIGDYKTVYKKLVNKYLLTQRENVDKNNIVEFNEQEHINKYGTSGTFINKSDRVTKCDKINSTQIKNDLVKILSVIHSLPSDFKPAQDNTEYALKKLIYNCTDRSKLKDYYTQLDKILEHKQNMIDNGDLKYYQPIQDLKETGIENCINMWLSKHPEA